MSRWISFDSSDPSASPTEDVRRLAADLASLLPAMRATQASGGGLKRPLLQDVARPAINTAGRAGGAGTATFARAELDAHIPSARACVSLQAGRAWPNNGAVLAVLAAASATDCDWLLLVVPHTYKGSTQADKVRQQLSQLAMSPGVALNLHGVGLLAY